MDKKQMIPDLLLVTAASIPSIPEIQTRETNYRGSSIPKTKIKIKKDKKRNRKRNKLARQSRKH